MSSVEPLCQSADRLQLCEGSANAADEEWVNSLTHGVGCALSLIAGAWLLRYVFQQGVTWLSLACLVYVVALIAVYAASTLSHCVFEPDWRSRFRAWDQGLIYLLITANFTPFATVYFDGSWHLITVVMWSLSIVGFVSKVAFHHRVDRVSLWLYLTLGWMAGLGYPKLIPVAPYEVLTLIVAGGLAYSVGSVLLANDHRFNFLHAGWHLLVIAGSTCHFVAVWKCIEATV
jgi:hemolysin III